MRVIWGRKLGTFSSPKWRGMVVEIRRISVVSRGLPSSGHNQREAKTSKGRIDQIMSENP